MMTMMDTGTTVSDGSTLPIGVNEYVLNVTRMYLYVPKYDIEPITPQITYRAPYVETFSTEYALADSTSHKFQVHIPEDSIRVIIALFDNRKAINTGVANQPINPTWFSNSVADTLTRLRVNYSSQMLTNPDYLFGTTISDHKRAYAEYVRNSMSLLSPGGSPMTYGQWLSNKIYVFRVIKPTGSRQTILDIEMDFSANTSFTSVYVGAMYNKELVVEYDDQLHARVEIAEV